MKRYFGNYDYYLEKSGILNRIAPAAPVRPDGGTAQESARQRRQERARARQAIQGELKKCAKTVAEIEERCNQLTDRKTFLVAKLSSGAKVDFAALKRELAEVEKQLEQCEKDWERSAMELEALRLENDRINSN